MKEVCIKSKYKVNKYVGVYIYIYIQVYMFQKRGSLDIAKVGKAVVPNQTTILPT